MLETYHRKVTVDEFVAEVQATQAWPLLVAVADKDKEIWLQRGAEWASVNPVNLSLMAKAALTGDLAGQEPATPDRMNHLWRLCNSLLDYDLAEARDQPARERIMTSAMMRWAYHWRVFEGANPLDLFARYWHLASWQQEYTQLNRDPDRVDLDACVRARWGLTLRQFMVIGFAFFIMSVHYAMVDSSRLFDNAADSGVWRDRTEQFLRLVARRLDEFGELYNSTPSKYYRAGHFMTEFNLLRDFPLVRDPNNPQIVAVPCRQFLAERLTTGLYYDILSMFGECESESNPRNPNPLNNQFSQFFGRLLEKYVVRQLRSAPGPRRVIEEFPYHFGGNEFRSPDAVIVEPSGVSFVEVKRHEPTLGFRTSADLDGLGTILRRGIAKAHVQNLNSIARLREGAMTLDGISADDDIRSVIICPESIPWFDLPLVRASFREEVDHCAQERGTRETDVHYDCDVLGIDELEMAVPYLCFTDGLRTLLASYQTYRALPFRVSPAGELKDYYFIPWFERVWRSKRDICKLKNPLLHEVYEGLEEEAVGVLGLEEHEPPTGPAA